MRAALILVVVLAGCPGPGPAAGGNGGNGSNGSGKAEQPDGTSARPTGDPATDLRTLVDEVVALVRGAGCPAFGGKLKSWTEKHRQHIGDLIAALEQSGDAAAATELDAYADEKKLVVVELAADCAGQRDDAWPAWEEFEDMIASSRGTAE